MITDQGESRVKALRGLCKAHGVELIEHPGGHFQLRGVYLVNYYPLSKRQTIYIAGTAGTIPSPSPEKAIQIATGTRNWSVVNTVERKGNYRGRKKRLWAAGVRHCHWCKVEFEKFEDCTLEHVIPLSKGGLDNPNNYALAHAKCNNERGNLLPHRQPRPRKQPPTPNSEHKI